MKVYLHKHFDRWSWETYLAGIRICSADFCGKGSGKYSRQWNAERGFYRWLEKAEAEIGWALGTQGYMAGLAGDIEFEVIR